MRSLTIQHPDWIIEGAYVEQGCDFIGTFNAEGGEVEDNSESLSFYRNEPDTSALLEEEEEEAMDEFDYLDVTEEITTASH